MATAATKRPGPLFYPRVSASSAVLPVALKGLRHTEATLRSIDANKNKRRTEKLGQKNGPAGRAVTVHGTHGIHGKIKSRPVLMARSGSSHFSATHFSSISLIRAYPRHPLRGVSTKYTKDTKAKEASRKDPKNPDRRQSGFFAPLRETSSCRSLWLRLLPRQALCALCVSQNRMILPAGCLQFCCLLLSVRSRRLARCVYLWLSICSASVLARQNHLFVPHFSVLYPTDGCAWAPPGSPGSFCLRRTPTGLFFR
jgi:hypothetical protein